MANQLTRYGNIEDSILRYLKANPDWERFSTGPLRRQNELNNKDIGGYNPRSFTQPISMESSFGVNFPSVLMSYNPYRAWLIRNLYLQHQHKKSSLHSHHSNSKIFQFFISLYPHQFVLIIV
jgi:hypothetical protein